MKHARAKCLLGCLVLLAPGCGLLTSTSVKTMLEKGDDSGQNRLVIRSVETVKLLNRNNPTYEFDSLVWQTKDGSDWKDKVVLRGAQLPGDAAKRRWVTALYSLDSESGNAILKVAEQDAAEKDPKANVVYSWREWDLVQKQEIKTIHVCSTPDEPFQGE